MVFTYCCSVPPAKNRGCLKLDPRAPSSFSLITADLDGISSSCLACLCAKAQGRLGWSIEKFQPAPEDSSVSVTWITPLGSRRKISVVYLLVGWRDYTHQKILVGGSPGGGGSEFPGSTPHPFPWRHGNAASTWAVLRSLGLNPVLYLHVFAWITLVGGKRGAFN